MLSLRPVPLLWGVTATLIGLHLVAIVIERALGIARTTGLLRQFDLNAEANLTAWFGSFLLLACAAVSALVTVWVRLGDPALGRRWAVLSLVLLAMSIDEGAQLHDMATGPLRRAFGLELGLFHFAWLIPGIAILLAVLVYLVPLGRALGPRERRLLLRAAAVYVTGAVVLEMAGGLVVDVDVEIQGYTLPYLAMITLEEGLELIGALLLLGALLHIAGHLCRPLVLGFESGPTGARIDVGAVPDVR